jgi:hypothetical protein
MRGHGREAIPGCRCRSSGLRLLNEIGARALRMHLGRVLEMAESSSDKWEYEAKVAKRFGFEQQLELPIPLPFANELRRFGILFRAFLAQS